MYKQIIKRQDLNKNNKLQLEYIKIVPENFNDLCKLIQENYQEFNKDNYPSYTLFYNDELKIYLSKDEFLSLSKDNSLLYLQMIHTKYNNYLDYLDKKIIVFSNYQDLYDYIQIIIQSEILQK